MAAKSMSSKAMSGACCMVGCCTKTCTDFRDFILRGNVVDLAIAVVIGSTFKELVNAFIAAFITPLLGMIGTGNSNELYFIANGSKFQYGLFITALLSFLIVCFVCFYAIIVPLMALIGRVYPHLAVLRDCPECFTNDLPGAATRCKNCCATLTPVIPRRDEAESVSKAPAPDAMA